MQKQLSQYFRNQRRVSKPSGSSGSQIVNTAYKKAKVSSSAEDDELSQRRNLELLSTTEEGSLSSNTYSNLIKNTFQMRRKFITEEAKSSKEILDRCPYLGKSSHVSSFLVKSLIYLLTGAPVRALKVAQ